MVSNVVFDKAHINIYVSTTYLCTIFNMGGDLQYPGQIPKLRHWINYKRKTKGTRL